MISWQGLGSGGSPGFLRRPVCACGQAGGGKVSDVPASDVPSAPAAAGGQQGKQPGPIIAVDGPAGAGKSTLARRVAQALGFRYLDTGAMYRAVTWAALSKGIRPQQATPDALRQVAQSIVVRVSPDSRHVWVDDTEVTGFIREPRVNQAVSWVARVPGVREQLVRQQREWAAGGNVVVDGRDIGTVVFPGAELKLFLTASPAERARRRWRELVQQGYQVELGELERQVEERDHLDSGRAVAPLRPAEDAVVVDSTGRSVNEVVAEVLRECERRGISSCTDSCTGSSDSC